MKQDSFDARMMICEHKDEWLSEHYETVYCGTPYCDGDEVHCLKCRTFIVKCLCQSCSGESGWSQRRWKRHWDRRLKKHENSN